MKGNSFVNYVKDSLSELTQVVWPTKNQAVKLSIIVLAFSIVFALSLGFLDYIFGEAHQFLLNINA